MIVSVSLFYQISCRLKFLVDFLVYNSSYLTDSDRKSEMKGGSSKGRDPKLKGDKNGSKPKHLVCLV